MAMVSLIEKYRTRKTFKMTILSLIQKSLSRKKIKMTMVSLKKYFPKNNFKNRTLKKMKYLSNQDQNIVSVKLILFYPKINK